VSRIAGPIVILLAGALSTIWVFLVPIFQAPDEPAHFDYAMSIYSAGRLIHLADGKRDWIVSPYTKYLMRTSDFDRIVWRSSMHVPRGYGSTAYFARLDADAPSLQAAQTSSGRISYIVALYPFGFYALEAAWMRVVSLFTGSLATLFFAARLLCVALTMLGLYFNYRTALNLRVPRWTSIALIAAIGFFPLTSLVSSYVQPDNLAYALVSAALFFATELRPGPLRLAPIVALGVSLGLLAITKYQFFISLAIPTALFVLVRVLQSKSAAAPRVFALAATAAPSILLLAIQQLMVNRPISAATAGPTTISLEPLRSVAAAGLGPTLRYVLRTTLAGFTDFFVSGGCAATFWQTIGWVDTPIVIATPSIELWIRGAIALTTIGVAAILIFYFCRNAFRLVAAAGRGHARSTVAVIAGDPVVNSYVCFVALMLALYVLTNNAFGAEGRQWYPYLFAAFLCFVWYAPRALSKRHHEASAILACVLLAYSLTASAFALVDLSRRYYGPQVAHYVTVNPRPSQIAPRQFGMLWPVADAAYHSSTGNVLFSFARGSRLLVVGAAISPDSQVAPSAVAVVVDSRAAQPVLANQYAYMIAEATHSVADGYRAFYSNVATSHLAEGAHTVAAYAAMPSQRRYAVVPPTRLFFVTDRDGQFSTNVTHALERAPIVRGRFVDAGACRSDLLLVSGSVEAEHPADRYSAVWLLVDHRPFPAYYRSSDGSFAGTVPTRLLGLGAHRVTAYAIAANSGRSFRVSQRATLRVAARSSEPKFPSDPPRSCLDPLAQLARS
jgi:Predicted membrane protein (DUF2142)